MKNQEISEIAISLDSGKIKVGGVLQIANLDEFKLFFEKNAI